MPTILFLNFPYYLQKLEPTPTADLDRTHDKVYECTTLVVKAVMTLSQGDNNNIIINHHKLYARV